MATGFKLGEALEQRDEMLLSEESKKILRAVSIEEFLSLEFPPRENVLAPWLPTQGLCMLYGPRGIGKTHVGIGVAVAVATGGSFLTWKAEKARPVLYLDGEMPAVVLQERFKKAITNNRADEVKGAPVEENHSGGDQSFDAPSLSIITPDLQKNGIPDLTSSVDQEMLEPSLSGVSLIIVDNISTLCRRGRENESESWLPVQEWALRMRTRGISVLFIHHAGKGGSQRGTSRREDVLDTIISLKRPGDYKPEEGARFEIHFEKARGIHGDEVKAIEAQLTTGEDEQQVWTVKTLEESLTKKVADLLNDQVPILDIIESLNVSKSTVYRYRKEAIQKGLIQL